MLLQLCVLTPFAVCLYCTVHVAGVYSSGLNDDSSYVILPPTTASTAAKTRALRSSKSKVINH
jgi:hypothetical protein